MNMPQAGNPMMPAAAPKSHAWLYWTIAAVIIVGALAWWQYGRPAMAPSTSPSPSGTPLSDINTDIKAVQDINVDAEMKQVDSDMTQL